MKKVGISADGIFALVLGNEENSVGEAKFIINNE